MYLKIVICREVERPSIPTLLPRHIVIPIALCREFKEIDSVNLPENIMKIINEKGYIVIDNSKEVLDILGIDIAENEYVKIFIQEY